MGATEQRWFLPDQPLKDSQRDQFAHADVAGNLLAMIRESRASGAAHRLTVGLTGPFGVGKSTVIELLKASLKGDRDDVVIRLSAERHVSDSGLQRSLIYSFAEALVREGVAKQDVVEKELRPLERASTVSAFDVTTLPVLEQMPKLRAAAKQLLWRAVQAALTVLGIALVAGVVVTAISDESVWRPMFLLSSAALAVLAASATPVFTILTRAAGNDTLLKTILTPPTVAVTQPRVEAADEYERTFASLAKLSRARLVIAVDDIDRLSTSQVLTALNTIRSFQLTCKPDGGGPPMPVFIVSADERIITAAIKESSPELAAADGRLELAVSGYLDRLFTQRQPMPPHPPADLTDYARALVTDPPHTGAQLLGAEQERVLRVLIHDGVRDPRHVIRLLNGFFGDLRLASQREGRATRRGINTGEITAHPRVLARLTVLRLDYPDFYEALRDDVDLLELMEAHIRGEDLDAARLGKLGPWLSPTAAASPGADGDGAVADALALDRRLGLQQFIGRTSGMVDQVPSLLPFLYLGQEEADRVLGTREAREARSYLVNRQIGPLRTRLAELAAGSHDEQLQQLVSLIRVDLDALSNEDLSAAVVTTAAVSADIPKAQLPAVAEAIAEALHRSPDVTLTVQDAVRLAQAASDADLRQRLATHALTGPQGQSDQDRQLRALHVLAEQKPLRQLLGDDAVTAELTRALAAAGSDGAATIEVLSPWVRSVQPEQLPRPVVQALSDLVLPAVAASEDDLPEGWADDALRVLQAAPPAGTAAKSLTTIVESGLAGEAPRLALAAAQYVGQTDQDCANFALGAYTGSIGDEGLVGGISPQTAEAFLNWVAAKIPEFVNYTSAKKTISVAERAADLAVALLGSQTLPDEHRDRHADQLIRAYLAANQGATRLTPLVAHVTGQWSAGDYQQTMSTLVTRLDDLTEANATEVTTVITGALTAAGENTPRARAAIRPLLATQAGTAALHALVPSLTGQLVPNNVNAARPALGVLQDLADAGGLQQAHANSVLQQLATLLQYDADTVAFALASIAALRWPPTNDSAAMEAVAPYAARLTTADQTALLDLIARHTGPTLQVPEPLQDLLVNAVIAAAPQSGARAGAQRGPETGPDAQETPDQTVQHGTALARGVTALRVLKLALTVPGLEPELARVLESEADSPQLVDQLLDAVTARADADEHATDQLLTAMAVARTSAGELVQAAVEARLAAHLSGSREMPSRTWGVLLTSIDATGAQRVAVKVADAAAGSAQDVRWVTPVLSAALQVPTLKAALDETTFADHLRRWVKELHDADVARVLAEAMGRHPDWRATAKEALGRRPRGGEERIAWEAAEEGLAS